jgi:hypothetical protein
MGDRRAQLPNPRDLLIPVLYVLGLGFVFLAAYLFLGIADPRTPMNTTPTEQSTSPGFEDLFRNQ